MKKFAFLCLALGLFCASPASAAAAPAEIKIGLMAPLTGSYAAEGEDMRRAVELLAEELNKAGGIDGRPVRIIVQDDGSDARTSAMAARRLSTQEVCAVIGTYGSAVTEASQNIYHRGKILQVATGSTSIRLSEKGYPLFFRTCPRDDDQGKVIVNTLLNLGFKKVAILHDNSAYAVGLAEEARAGLNRHGIGIAAYDALTPGGRDYSAMVTRLRGAAPDVILFTGYYPEAAMLLRQMRATGWNVPMLGGDATNNADLVKIGGGAAVAGFRFVSPPMPGDLDSQVARDFITAYRAKYNGDMPRSIWAVNAGDAFNVIVEAIRRAGDNPEKMAAYLHDGFKDFESLTGPISFDAKGDRVGDLYRLYLVNEAGEFVLQPRQ